MTTRNTVSKIVLALFLALVARTNALAQTPNTATEFWPALNLHTQLFSSVRVLAFAELKEGEDFPYQQFNVGAGLGYQWKRFSRAHLVNIDRDKESYLVAGAGYEYLTTVQSGTSKYENRLAVEATPRYRPPAGFLLEDRNRVEFRWVNGVYSTRYRNRLTIDRDFLVRDFRFTLYASAEAYYDFAKDSWNEAQYAAGIQCPYKSVLMLQAYYLRQNCDTCSPEHLNVVGVTLNVFLRNTK